MLVPITSLYAAVLAAGYAVLSVRVVLKRSKLKLPEGDGGDPGLQRAQRVHGHFAEYVPLLLVLMLLLELGKVPAVFMHTYGLLLVLSRVIHAIGLSSEPEDLRWRKVSMVCTLTLLLSAAALLGAGLT